MSVKRISAWLLCIVLLAGLFSFSVHLAGHDCGEEPCSVCGIIAMLRILCLILPAVRLSGILFRAGARTFACVSHFFSSLTLVSLKIRLDN